jgi:hypothetical protein
MPSQLERTSDGVTQTAGSGAVAVQSPKVRHSVKARSAARALIANYPVRDFR